MTLLLLLACGADDATVADHDHEDLATGQHGHDSWASADHTHPDTGNADPDRYTDEEAVAAVQNDDPWTDPDRANLENLWHQHDRGYQWLDDNRWTMDNRTDPPGASDAHELVQMFHETPECDDSMAFADCNSTAALKFYVNGPRITDHDWSEAGFATAAVRQYNTHASGLYLVSFGRNFTPTDYGYGVIAPSGIHLEPHGEHQALRIDGTENAGENARIDVMAGATGLAIYGSDQPAGYCEELGRDCDQTRIATLRSGILRLEDLTVERSADDARNGGVVWVSDTSVGIEHFYSWHTDSGSGLPVHCTWNDTVTDHSLVRVTAYSTSPDLTVAHSYAIVDVWGPGNAPASCTATQNIKTNAAGVYGYDFSTSVAAGGGYSVAILGADEAPLDPGAWDEADRPAFFYEVIEPL